MDARLNTVATPQQREAVMARYGYFHVSVAHDTDAIQTLLSDPNTGQPMEPDARGLYWYRDPGMPGVPASWWAVTRYTNVIAAWMAGGEQRTEVHWDRMNAELRAAAAAMTQARTPSCNALSCHCLSPPDHHRTSTWQAAPAHRGRT